MLWESLAVSLSDLVQDGAMYEAKTRRLSRVNKKFTLTGQEIIVPDYLVAGLQQPIGQRAADEPYAACYEIAQGFPSHIQGITYRLFD